MILNVGFDYTAYVTRGRKRKEEHVTLRSSVAVVLPERDAMECPVAAWWSPPRMDHAAPRVAIRVVDGVPAEPVCRAGGTVGEGYVDPRNTGQGVVTAVDLAGGVDVMDIAGSYVMTVSEKGSDITREGLPHDTKVVSDLEQVVAAQVRRLVEGLCLVDGVLHRSGGMPVLEADGYERSYKPRRLRVGGFEGPFDATRVHRLDRWEEALAEGGKEARGPAQEHPVVLIPSALDPDLPSVMAKATAESLANLGNPDRSRGTHVIGSLPTPALMAWVDVRDMSRAGVEGGDLIPALIALHDACDAGVRRTLEYDFHMLDRCLARCAEHDIDPHLANMTF